MNRISLRARLFAGAIAAIFVALAVAWLALSTLFDRHIERRLVDDLTRQGLQLAGTVELGGDRLSVTRPPSDPRFERPASGLYWQVSGPTMRVRSRSLWDQVLPPGVTSESRWATRSVRGPFGQALILVERSVHIGDNPRRLSIQVAADCDTLRPAREDFGRELGLSLALLWAVLSLAAWVQVGLGLRPLADIQRRVDALRRNADARLSGAFPKEVQPLTEAIDALADARTADMVRARRRAADLAHGLKTPLAALAALTRRVGDSDPAVRAGLDQAIAAVSAAVQAELGRARAGAAQAGGGRSSPRDVAERVVNVLEHTAKGGALIFEIDIAPELRVPVAEEDLTELLGALAENAARHARRRVAISARTEPASLVLRIGDDGDAALAESLAARLNAGARLDESAGGHGLGVAIARDIAEATGGVLSFGVAALGGVGAEIRWPHMD